MAGHSKWANIRHRKGAQDAKKGKIFSKLIKEITVAVKSSGGDPEFNPRLRTAVQNARSQNMPGDTIDRAIKKALGEGGQPLEEATFEGHGPGGVAFFLECVTDNKTRTVGNIRSYFRKFGGHLGKNGCVEFMFSQKGVLILDAPKAPEALSLEMIEYGAEDIFFEGGEMIVVTAKEDFDQVQKALEHKGVAFKGELQRIPNIKKSVSKESFKACDKLFELFEGDDDVQRVYHNAEES